MAVKLACPQVCEMLHIPSEKFVCNIPLGSKMSGLSKQYTRCTKRADGVDMDTCTCRYIYHKELVEKFPSLF